MKKLSLILMSIIALGMMTSCSSSNDENVNTGPVLKDGVTKTLTLNIKGGISRTVGALPADEAKVNNLLVLVYDNNTEGETAQKFERVVKIENPVVGEAAGDKPKVFFKTTNPSFFVLANVPLNIADGLVGQGLTAFQALTASLDITSIDGTSNGASQISTALPMVGSTSTITNVGENSFTADIPLYRMVSRVVLNSFTTNYAGEASFTVTDVFLYNVNSTSTFANTDITSDTKASLRGEPTTGTPCVGMRLADEANGSTVSNLPLAQYMINNFSAAPYSASTPVYFYVFPNKASVYGNKTKLIIKGTYHASSADETGTTKYYVCVVNAAPEPGKVVYGESIADAGTGTIGANRTYSINITAVGAPVDEAKAGSSEDPASEGASNIEMTVSVTPWAANIVQNVTL